MIAVPVRRLSRTALAGAVAVLWAGACGDDVQGPLDAGDDGPLSELLSALIVSNPAARAGAVPAFNSSSIGDGIVFVSLPPGSVPNGVEAVIQSRRTEAQATAAMVDGGFDPIPVAATAGDTLDIRIELAVGAPLLVYSVVPASVPPVIVRTDPPPQKRDVPLNAVMLVVFSEPIDAATLTASSVQLLLDGVPVAGTLEFGEGVNLAATFAPAEPLAPEAEYTLLITREVKDLDGDALEAPVTVDFATGLEATSEPPPQAGVISGVVHGVTTTGVSPLDGARVEFFRYFESGGGSYLGSTVTDSQGRYSFPASGSVNVYASYAGFSKPCVNFGDGTQDIVLYSEEAFLSNGVQPPPEPSPMVSGVVYEEVDGELTPLPGIIVYLDLLAGLGQVGAIALSDSNGEYFLCRIPTRLTYPVIQARRGPEGDLSEYPIEPEDQELDIVFRR